MKWTTADPLLRSIRARVRLTGLIDADAVADAASCDAERKIVVGVLKQFREAHPDRWTEPAMLGSLLKRLRNRGEYSW